jgi:hypothetical protein
VDFSVFSIQAARQLRAGIARFVKHDAAQAGVVPQPGPRDTSQKAKSTAEQNSLPPVSIRRAGERKFLLKSAALPSR